MATVIRFGSFKAVASSKKYMPIDDLSKSTSFGTKANDPSGKKPTIKKEGPELRKESFSVSLTDVLGVSVESTINQLLSMCESGTSRLLYRNGKPESKYYFTLVGVEIGDIEINPRTGKILSAVAALDFEEYPNKRISSKSEKKR